MSAMPPRRGRQRGIALLVVVVVVVVGSTFLLLRSLNAATWRAERYRVTQEALVAAKEALVARAVADDNRPGSLPCPDTNNDGIAEGTLAAGGTQCPSYIGRLPWRTLDLPDLRDASGERLWYALSSTHRDNPSAEPINSNTAGQLTLTGTQPATNLLAILVAPGSALIRAGAAMIQDRSCSAACNPVDFLDFSGGVDNADGDDVLVSAPESQTFNDRVLAIYADDVMPLIEKRAGREFAANLRAHYDAWQLATGKGFYPWAAPFINPENVQAGVSGTQHGHLPLSAAGLFWTSASSPLGACTGVGTTQIECTALVVLGTTLNIDGRVGNLGTAFVDPPSAGNVAVSGILLGPSNSTWTLNTAAEALDFSFSAPILGLVTVQVTAPGASAWTTSSWIGNNRWDRVAYYTLSVDYAINGSGACGSCIAVANTAPAGKHAVVIMTGRSLTGQTARPVPTPASVADYLEGANQTPADLAFEQNFRGTAFNDQPVVVRP